MYGEAILNEYINTCRIRSTIQMVVDAADMHDWDRPYTVHFDIAVDYQCRRSRLHRVWHWYSLWVFSRATLGSTCFLVLAAQYSNDNHVCRANQLKKCLNNWESNIQAVGLNCHSTKPRQNSDVVIIGELPGDYTAMIVHSGLGFRYERRVRYAISVLCDSPLPCTRVPCRSSVYNHRHRGNT